MGVPAVTGLSSQWDELPSQSHRAAYPGADRLLRSAHPPQGGASKERGYIRKGTVSGHGPNSSRARKRKCMDPHTQNQCTESQSELLSGPESSSGDQSPSCDVSPEELNSQERLYEQLFDRIRDGLLIDPVAVSVPERVKHGLVESHGLLWKDHCMYVPNTDTLRQDLIWWHHDVPWAAHMGVRRAVEAIRHQFWWPGMRTDVEQYIKSCTSCQSNKPDRRLTRPLLNPLVQPDACWRTLGVDLITDLPKATSGHDAICVFVCHLSKMCRLVPTRKDLNAEGFAKLFMHNVFVHYGFPERVVSDRGTQWNNDFFRALCTRANIALHLSTAYHPQTNGLVERTNEVVEAALRHYVSADMKDWDEHLPLIEFALNAAYHEALGTSPFALNRVCVPRNPFQVLIGEEQPVCKGTPRTLGMSKLTRLGNRTIAEAQANLSRARRCVDSAKSRMKVLHDAKIAGNPRIYQPGDRVWLSVRNQKTPKHPSKRHKLLPRYWGPFVVLEMVGPNAVRLELPTHMSIHPVVSIALVKPFCARAGSPPPVQIRGEDEWEVDGLLDHKTRNGIPHFCVQWKGNYENSWHEVTDLENCPDIMLKYLLNLPKHKLKALLKLLPQNQLDRLDMDSISRKLA